MLHLSSSHISLSLSVSLTVDLSSVLCAALLFYAWSSNQMTSCLTVQSGWYQGDQGHFDFCIKFGNFILQNRAEFIYLPQEHGSFSTRHPPLSVMNENPTKQLVSSLPEVHDIEEHFRCGNSNTGNCSGRCRTNPKILYSPSDFLAPAIITYLSVSKNANCDTERSSIIVPVGKFIQFNPHAALYSQKAFWALPFVSEGGMFLQVWPHLIQKLLWISGNRICLKGPLALNVIDQGTAAVVQNWIHNWKCERNTLAVCTLSLVDLVVKQLQLDREIILQGQAWVETLSHLDNAYLSTVQHVSAQHPVPHEDTLKPNMVGSGNKAKEITKIYIETCSLPNHTPTMQINFAQPWTKFEDILLIVVFNTPMYHSIPFVETLYRPFFPKIVYCGPGTPNYQSKSLRNLQLEFYSFGQNKNGHPVGAFHYACMVGVASQNHSVAGYLFTSDDLIFSISKVLPFNRNQTWYVRQTDTINDWVVDPKFSLWGFGPYKKQIHSLLSKMSKYGKNSLIGTCYNQLKQLNGAPYRVNGGFSDLYYIPQRLAPKFTVLGTLFLKEDVFVEIAVPTIIQCTESLQNVVELVGEYRKRDKWEPWKKFTKERFFDKSYMYLHFTKWGALSPDTPSPKTDELRKFYCTKVLPWLHDPQGREPK